MRMVFDGFRATRDSLLNRFEKWLDDVRVLEPERVSALVADAGLALDWKWGYADGDLASWRCTDVAEFLLEWCPQKLSVALDEAAKIPGAVATFATFLESEGLLSTPSSSAGELVELASSISAEFGAAMADPSKFGMAKSLAAAAEADGIDMTDPDQVQAWIATFNARPEDERRAVTSGATFGGPKRPALPPVAPPDDEEVEASKAEAPIVNMFAAFAGFVGEGRKLTKNGNLTLADARVLVERLGTGDVIDEQIGERTFKTRSSSELRRLRLVFAWARKAAVVRVAHGRVIATKAGLELARAPGRPGRFFDRAVDALLAMGPLSAQRDPDGWVAWPEVNELLERVVVHMLTGPYVAQRPVPIDDIAAVVTNAVLDAFRFPSLRPEDVARILMNDVVDIVDALALAGIVRRLDVGEPAITGAAAGGTVELTAAGVVTTQRLLRELGYEVPTEARFANASAAELLAGTDLDDFPMVWGELQAWMRRREPADAAHELAEAVRVLDDPALRNVALAVMGDLDLDLAAAEVRKLAAEPVVRGFALCWLVDHGFEEREALFDLTDVSWFVDVLIHRFVTGGPDALCESLALAGNHDRQIQVIGRLWRSPSTATDTVLAAIGELHPTKIVAKAARKARFQRRSWVGA